MRNSESRIANCELRQADSKAPAGKQGTLGSRCNVIVCIFLLVGGQFSCSRNANTTPPILESAPEPIIIIGHPAIGATNDICADIREGCTFRVTINPTLPPYQIRLIANADNVLELVEITQLGVYPRLIQVIKPSMQEPPYKGAEYFIIGDINGDGYQDIQILDWWGTTGNTGHEHWLYNPEAQSFVHHPELDAYEWDHKPGMLRSHYNDGTGKSGWSTYRFENGKIVLLHNKDFETKSGPQQK